MSLFDRIAELPLRVDDHVLIGLEQAVSDNWVRRTTEVRLHGAGREGAGEDVNYSSADQVRFQATGGKLPLAGDYTLGSFSEHLHSLELFDAPPADRTFRPYRRWALESAALELALAQSATSLPEALGRRLQPLRFVKSMGLGAPPSLEPVLAWRRLYPKLRFKLDVGNDWTREFMRELNAAVPVDVVDLKGHYRGDWIDNTPDAGLYRGVAEEFPEAYIEDPWLDPEIDDALEPYRARITWDAPIHAVADVLALPFPPRVLNVKPSRFGTLERLFAAYDYCAGHSIGMYGGGQFELGVGRGQAQLLAALFHPDMPNDLAPRAYNTASPVPGLPQSPLDVAP